MRIKRLHKEMNITYPGIVLAGTQESARVADAKKCAHFILSKIFMKWNKVWGIQDSTQQYILYIGEQQKGKKERRKEGKKETKHMHELVPYTIYL